MRSGNTYKNDLVTGAYSLDGGATWKAFASEPPGTVGPYWRGEGRVAISPDAKTVVWSPTGVAPNYTTDFGTTWYPCVGGSVNLSVAADTVNSSKYYAYDTEAGSIVVSRDGAQSFKAAGAGLPVVKGSAGAPPRASSPASPAMRASSSSSQTASCSIPSDSGTTLQQARTRSSPPGRLRRGAPGRRDPGRVHRGHRLGGPRASSAPTTPGATWVRINDAGHGYGQIRVITGDPRIYGRVYFGTGGRGIIYGDQRPRIPPRT